MIKILQYQSSYLHEHRALLVERLKTHLNNVVEEACDENGRPIGSGMMEDLSRQRRSIVWIAWVGGEPVAWSTVTYRRRGPALQASVYVHPNSRRKGTGTRLLVKMKQYAQDKKRPLISQAWDKKGCYFYQNQAISHTFSWDFVG